MGWWSKAFGEFAPRRLPKEYRMRRDMPDFVVIDVKTTGPNPKQDKIIQVAAVRYVNHMETEHFSQYINPKMPIPRKVMLINEISDDVVCSSPSFPEIQRKYFEFIDRAPMIFTYNAEFAVDFLAAESGEDIRGRWQCADVLPMAQQAVPWLKSYNLESVCDYIGCETDFRNTLDYCRACALVVNFLCAP